MDCGSEWMWTFRVKIDTDLYMLAEEKTERGKYREGERTTEPKTDGKMTKLQKRERGRTSSNTGTAILQT